MKRILRIIFYKWIIKRFISKEYTTIDVGAGKCLFEDCATKLDRYVTSIDSGSIDSDNTDKSIQMDYRDIKENYDVFFNSQFIEHIDSFKFMEIAKKHCNKLIITITTRPCKKFWDSPGHIKPYTKKAIGRMYLMYGFTPIFSKNLYPTKSFIVIGEKK